jgi:hypothetical protein
MGGVAACPYRAWEPWLAQLLPENVPAVWLWNRAQCLGWDVVLRLAPLPTDPALAELFIEQLALLQQFATDHSASSPSAPETVEDFAFLPPAGRE